MSEKDEALKHLSEIKSALVDKETFFPYNYNALMIWGVIGMIMTLFMGIIFKSSIFYGVVFSAILMSAGTIIEGFLTKEVNRDYDIEGCTKKQKFIVTIFGLLSFFAIALTALLTKYELVVLAYPIWIFLIGIGHFSVGFILNIKIIEFSSLLKIFVAILLLIASFFISDLGSLNSTFFYFVQGITFALLGVFPMLIGRKLKKEL